MAFNLQMIEFQKRKKIDPHLNEKIQYSPEKKIHAETKIKHKLQHEYRLGFGLFMKTDCQVY